MIYLQDEIINLRAVEPDDADAMWLIESDSSQWLQNGMSAPYSRENLRNYASGYLADPYQEGQVRLVIETLPGDRSKGEIAGLLDLYQLSACNHTGFAGIYICRKFRRQGYGTRALRLMERYAVELLNLRVVAAKVMDNNVASHALFRKAGYDRTGVLHKWMQTGATYHDLHIYEKALL